MNITADNFPIYTAFAGCAAGCLCFLLTATQELRNSSTPRLNFPAINKWGAIFIGISCASTTYANIYLLQQILSKSRYDIAYIRSYSGPDDSALYLASSLWAGHEGSMLFWTGLSAIFGWFICKNCQKYSSTTLFIWCVFHLWLCALSINGDPFRISENFRRGDVGVGLNPLLKNPWMAFHPPFVFLGYALSSITGALGLSASLKPDDRFARKALPWAMASWLMMSIGIAMGMAWAYVVLGWGGYWSWDPVENASLLPWLAMTALVHFLIVETKTGTAARYGKSLACASYGLVILSAFLTRSGILSDVSTHSFSSDGSYSLLLAHLIFGCAVFAISLISSLATKEKTSNEIHATSREFATLMGNIVLLLLGLVVLAGIIIPIITGSSMTQPEFYTRISAIAAAIILQYLLISYIFNWRAKLTNKRAIRRYFAILGLAILSSLTMSLFKIIPDNYAILDKWFIAFLLSYSLILAIEIARSSHKTKLIKSGSNIAHIGAALAVAGMISSSTGDKITLTLEARKAPLTAFGWQISYNGARKAGANEYYADVKISQDGKLINAPLAIKYGSQGAVCSPFIISQIQGDTYLSPVDIQFSKAILTAKLTKDGWIAQPTKIKGVKYPLSLRGIAVENKSAVIEYQTDEGRTKIVKISPQKPAIIDGASIEFVRFIQSSGDEHSISAGVEIKALKDSLDENITLEISRKPMIWLLWTGLCLILAGAFTALIRRCRLKGEQDGILSDSPKLD